MTMDKCSHCYIVDEAKLSYCPNCEKVKKTSQGTSTVDVLDKIRTEIEQNAYPIVHGVNNHEKGMTLYGILQILDKYRNEVSK